MLRVQAPAGFTLFSQAVSACGRGGGRCAGPARPRHGFRSVREGLPVAVRRFTIALGCGQQKGYVTEYRGAIQEVNLLKKVRLAIAVNDDFVEKTVEGIIEGARTGNIGDGKIFVVPMDECIRIRTGERGPEAIG